MSIRPVAGIRLAAVSAGIKATGASDLTLIELQEGSHCAAVFTQNAFRAAPVEIAAAHLEQCAPRLLLINSGNANAGTGSPGLEHATQTCQSLAEIAACRVEQVLPFSTGVIGETLPVDRICQALPAAHDALQSDAWEAAAKAIMTTDTGPKLACRTLELNGTTVTITGICKGAGMIEPDMATMLAYVATDAAIEPSLLQRSLRDAVKVSFNRISVDGDTSTNDACVLMATGAAGNQPVIDAESEEYAIFFRHLQQVFIELAQAIVRDGEGATKFISLEISGARDEQEATRVGKTVANSPLVKTAFFASDPNWGRILAAVGRAGLEQLDINAVQIYLGEVCIVRDGGRAPDYQEEAAQQVMDQSDISVRIVLGRGSAEAVVWTCDFSYDYVRINAEYRS